jgi:hypothetical protein
MPQIKPLKSVTAPLHFHIEQLFADIASNPFFYMHNPSEALDLDLVSYNAGTKKFENKDIKVLSTSEDYTIGRVYNPSTPAGKLLEHFAISAKLHPNDLVTQQITNALGIHEIKTSGSTPPNRDIILSDLPLKDQIAFILDREIAK